MALRFYYEFQNDKAETWRVEIHDEVHAGSDTEISAAGEGFTLTYDGNDDDLYQPIVGSKCALEFYNRDSYSTEMDDFLDDLLTRDEDDIKVAIYYDPDNTNTLYWAGIVFADQTDRENTSYPFKVTLTAGDDIAALKAIPYNDDGTAYTGLATLLSHAVNCLNKTRTSPTFTTEFWSLTDDFMAWGKFLQYDDGTNAYVEPWENIGFFHEDMYGAGAQLSDGEQYRSAYEILSAICDTLTCSLMLSEGLWRFVPRNRHATANSQEFDLRRSDGTLNTNGDIQNNWLTIGTNADILSGWKESHLNPVTNVSKLYRFRGNVPIIDENVVESDFDTTTYDADTWTVPSGESLYILANPKVTQTADGTRTGNARFLRYKFIVQVKAGDNYLKRTASTISSSTTAYTDGGTPVDVFNVLLGTHSWTTTSTDRFEFWTSPINALDGDSFSAFIPLITDGVPDDSSGVTVTVDVEAYEADGTTSSAITSAALADAVVSIEPLRIFIGDSETNTLDTLLYTSAADNNAYDVFDLPDAILGDQVSSAATRGSLRHTASEEYTSDGWGPSGATDKANLEWQVFTQMAQRREVTMLQIGTLYAGFHAAHYVYLYESTTWVPYRWSFRANSAEYDVELFEAAQNTGGITVAEPDRFDGDGSNDTGAGSGVALGLAGSIEATARSAQDTGQQLSVLFPADASGPRLRNAVGDTNYVELIARSGLSSNETVTIPSAITTFIGANGRCGTASTEYYLPLGNGSSILTSLDFKNEFVCVQAVEILDVYVRFIQTPGAVTLKLYNNGSQVDSLSPPAGTSQAYDFSGNEFDVGERIAFSIECANANIDCQVTIQMKLL